MSSFRFRRVLDPFIVPDGEDESSGHFVSFPSESRIHSVPAADPSRYAQAINAISQQYESGGVEDEEGEGDEVTDEGLEVLDDIGLWEAVGDWLSGALNFEYLMRMLDFQHGKYTKIGYWENLVSELAFEHNLDKREQNFKAISLVEHHRRLTTYGRTAVLPSKSPMSLMPEPRSLSRPSTPSNSIQLWSVRIVPGKSCDLNFTFNP